MRKAWQQKLVEADERYRLLRTRHQRRDLGLGPSDQPRRLERVARDRVRLPSARGGRPDRAGGRLVVGHVHADERDDVLATFLAAAHGNAEVWAKEYRFLAADGTYRYVFDRGYIARNSDGERSGWSAACRTSRRCGVRGGARTPLFPREGGAGRGRGGQPAQGRVSRDALPRIANAAQLHPRMDPAGARGPPAPERVSRALLSIEQNAQAQKGLVESLLDLSSIVTGKLALHVAVTDLSAVVRAAIDVVRRPPTRSRSSSTTCCPRPRRTRSPTRRDCSRSSGTCCRTRSSSTPAGGRVSVTLHADANDATIVVTDTGDGITDDFLPHVFERFRQADSSTSRTYGGRGWACRSSRSSSSATPARSRRTARGAAGAARSPCRCRSSPASRRLRVEDGTKLQQSGVVVVSNRPANGSAERRDDRLPDTALCDLPERRREGTHPDELRRLPALPALRASWAIPERRSVPRPTSFASSESSDGVGRHGPCFRPATRPPGVSDQYFPASHACPNLSQRPCLSALESSRR